MINLLTSIFFLWGADDFADDFLDIKNKVNVRSIPAVILRIYRIVFK